MLNAWLSPDLFFFLATLVLHLFIRLIAMKKKSQSFRILQRDEYHQDNNVVTILDDTDLRDKNRLVTTLLAHDGKEVWVLALMVILVC